MEKPTSESGAVRAAGMTERAPANGALANDRVGGSPILKPAWLKIVVRPETHAIVNPSVAARRPK